MMTAVQKSADRGIIKLYSIFVQVLRQPGTHTNRPSSNTPDSTAQATISQFLLAPTSATRCVRVLEITNLELNRSRSAESVFFPRGQPKRMADRKQGPLALNKSSDGYGKRKNPALGSCGCGAHDMGIAADDGDEIFPTSPKIIKSMSSSSDGGRGRAGGKYIDRYHPNHTADYGQCVTAKVTSMCRMDSRPSEDKGSVESEGESPRATPEELPEQARNSAEGTGERLKALHQRLQEARDASNNGTITHEHFNGVDRAINNAIHHLPLVHSGDGSSPLRWRVPDQVSANEDNVPHGLVERFRDLLKGHEGHLGDLLLNSRNQAELRAIFPGVEKKELQRLLNETQICVEAGAESHN